MKPPLEPLQALQSIKKSTYLTHLFTYYDTELEIIETALKALEIIKNKKVNCYMFWACNNLESYNEEVVVKLTQEEYEFLKETLK